MAMIASAQLYEPQLFNSVKAAANNHGIEREGESYNEHKRRCYQS